MSQRTAATTVWARNTISLATVGSLGLALALYMATSLMLEAPASRQLPISLTIQPVPVDEIAQPVHEEVSDLFVRVQALLHPVSLGAGVAPADRTSQTYSPVPQVTGSGSAPAGSGSAPGGAAAVQQPPATDDAGGGVAHAARGVGNRNPDPTGPAHP